MRRVKSFLKGLLAMLVAPTSRYAEEEYSDFGSNERF